MIIKSARLFIEGVNIADRPTVTRTRSGAWLVKGWGPTRRYSTRRQASRAAMVRRRHRRGGTDLQIEQIDPQWHTLGAMHSRSYIGFDMGAGVDYGALMPRPDPAAVEAELRKIPGVVSATVRFNLPESVELLGTVTISVAEPRDLPCDLDDDLPKTIGGPEDRS